MAEWHTSARWALVRAADVLWPEEKVVGWHDKFTTGERNVQLCTVEAEATNRELH